VDPIIAQTIDPMYAEIIKVVGGVIASALGMLFIWIATQVARKLGYAISAEQEAQLKYFAQQAAKKMEELAAAKIKEQKAAGQTPVPMSPAEQMAGAVETVMQNLPKVTAEKAANAVTAALPELGIGASGPIVVADAKPVVVAAPVVVTNPPGTPA
jgi:hypothetical protein